MEKQLTKSVDEQVQPQLSQIEESKIDEELTLVNQELLELQEELKFFVQETKMNTEDVYNLLQERDRVDRKVKDIITFFSFAIVLILVFMLIFWR